MIHGIRIKGIHKLEFSLRNTSNNTVIKPYPYVTNLMECYNDIIVHHKDTCSICYDEPITVFKCPKCDTKSCKNCIIYNATNITGNNECIGGCHRRYTFPECKLIGPELLEIRRDLLVNTNMEIYARLQKEKKLIDRFLHNIGIKDPEYIKGISKNLLNNTVLGVYIDYDIKEYLKSLGYIWTEIYVNWILFLKHNNSNIVGRCTCNSVLEAINITNNVVVHDCINCNNRLCTKCGITYDKTTILHQCNDEDIKNYEYILTSSKNCPGCATRIIKTEGCDAMWCPNCKITFHWETLQRIGYIHNPERDNFLEQLYDVTLRESSDFTEFYFPNHYKEELLDSSSANPYYSIIYRCKYVEARTLTYLPILITLINKYIRKQLIYKYNNKTNLSTIENILIKYAIEYTDIDTCRTNIIDLTRNNIRDRYRAKLLELLHNDLLKLIDINEKQLIDNIIDAYMRFCSIIKSYNNQWIEINNMFETPDKSLYAELFESPTSHNISSYYNIDSGIIIPLYPLFDSTSNEDKFKSQKTLYKILTKYYVTLPINNDGSMENLDIGFVVSLMNNTTNITTVIDINI